MRFFKHPEQMTSGSIWKVRGEDALDYLRHDWDGRYYHGNATQWIHGLAADRFDLDFLFFLIELKEIKSGVLNAKFLVGEGIVTAQIYRSLWDTTFELVHKTTKPKGEPRPKLLFGKYPVESLREMIEKGDE